MLGLSTFYTLIIISILILIKFGRIKIISDMKLKEMTIIFILKAQQTRKNSNNLISSS